MGRESSCSDNLVASRLLRVGFFGFFGGRNRGRFHRRHLRSPPLPALLSPCTPLPGGIARHYSPAFSSIIVTPIPAHAVVEQPGRQPPSRFAYQNHDALSAVRAPRHRQDQARHRNGGFGTRIRTGADQAWLAAGQTIRVEDAIKGLVTRSANDAAVVIAEALGGSEDEFARHDDPQGAHARYEQERSIATRRACLTTSR